MKLIKAHAFGNDFLLMEHGLTPTDNRPAVARALCNRHRGLGADGLILYSGTNPTRMDLLNADGSYSEISGNGVRCLAAWLVDLGSMPHGSHVVIDTDAGAKRLELLDRRGTRMTLRAEMGQPEDITTATLDVDGEMVKVVTLRVGNPQCVVLGDVTQERLHSLAAKLAVHRHFPHGTNVELAALDDAGHVRILIWERGVGPTEASGTGACAAAVVAMSYGGAGRDVSVAAPGGVQRVEWRDDGLYLTGWAEIIAECRWRVSLDDAP